MTFADIARPVAKMATDQERTAYARELQALADRGSIPACWPDLIRSMTERDVLTLKRTMAARP